MGGEFRRIGCAKGLEMLILTHSEFQTAPDAMSDRYRESVNRIPDAKEYAATRAFATEIGEDAVATKTLPPAVTRPPS